MDVAWLLIYIVIFITYFATNIKRNKPIPYSLVFVLSFCIFPMLSTFGLGGLYLPSFWTHFCVIFSLLSYLMGYSIGRNIKIKHHYGYEYETNYKILLFLNLICLGVLLYLLPKVAAYLAVKEFADVREFGVLEFLGDARMAALYGSFVKPILAVSFLIIVDDLFQGRKFYWPALIIVVANMVMDSIFFAGRALLVQCVYYIFFYVLFFVYRRRKTIRISRKLKIRLFLASALVITVLSVVVIFLSEQRTGADSATVMIDHLVWYYVGPFLLFDYYVLHYGLLDISSDMLFGTALFGPIYNFFYMGVSALIPSIDYQGTDHVIALVTQNLRLPIGPGIYINAAVTAMYPFLKDFWFIGLWFGFAFYGAVTRHLEHIYKLYQDDRIRIITLLVLYVVYKLGMRYELGPTLFISIVLVFAMFRKKK